MNRLIIVGNGFDLAHGLPTGYCDFIDWYWKRVFEDLIKQDKFAMAYNDELISFMCKFSHTYSPKAFDDFKKIMTYQEYDNFIESLKTTSKMYHGYSSNLKFKNGFFSTINDARNKNWVDIENEYYKLLIDSLKYKNNLQVKILNQEFDVVKRLLEKYLFENVEYKYDFSESIDTEKIIDIFNLSDRLSKPNKFLQEFDDNEQEHLMDWIKHFNDFGYFSIGNYDLEVKNLFLNFNYTPTVDIYSSIMNKSNRYQYGRSNLIQIHGKLEDFHNPINFGFGDEMDDDYKAIEKKDDNEYLRNMKSFQYLQNSNYKNMLSFIESDKFQVYIMGHSCGLSDRILLNKIFEHNNCKSIKVFYYKNEESDNYTEIVQNISRHFNKKEMMRERIVNKTLCEPLPQIKLPLK
jgi:flagellar basal body rod protein FlgB